MSVKLFYYIIKHKINTSYPSCSVRELIFWVSALQVSGVGLSCSVPLVPGEEYPRRSGQLVGCRCWWEGGL